MRACRPRLPILSASALAAALAGVAHGVSAQAGAPTPPAEMAGYLLVPNEKVPEEYDAGFSMYVAAWPLLQEYPGSRFQTGLFGTWMFAQYDKTAAAKHYSDIEGGLGWWRDTRYATETPKFIMGGVAPDFRAWANGPGAGKGRDWNEPKGKYGVAQLSPWVLWPPDGLNLKQGTCGEWFGYGYLPLPLASAKSTTAGKDIPTGDHCWTLFLSTESFKGPVAFFTPYFWSSAAVEEPRLAGVLLDRRPSNPNRALQMETQYVPCVVATDGKGEAYARIAPTRFPRGPDGDSPLVHRVTSYRKAALWDAVKAWFEGGAAASGAVDSGAAVVHRFPGHGGATWRIYTLETPKEERMPVAWKAIASPFAPDPSTFAYRWSSPLARPTDAGAGGLVTLPEYYHRVSTAGQKAEWAPVPAEDVPAETGLTQARFERPAKGKPEPYVTPDDPQSCWKKPGPVAGPFEAYPGDGSVVTYYWYRFADQPALLNADLSEQEREAMQVRVEKLHRSWTKDRDYLAPPATGRLAAIDPALIVTPPPGLEVGYVPIATRQAARESASGPEKESEPLAALTALSDHIRGKKRLGPSEIAAHKLAIDRHRAAFGRDATTTRAAFELVATYDETSGPLWVARAGFSRGNKRKPTPPANDIHWTVYNVMQAIMDRVYTPENVARHAAVLDGFRFGSAAHFPGAVDPPADPDTVYRVKINASYPKTWGRKEAGFARRPTGAYLAPGSIATVTVPESLVGKGYQVRVGAHSWDNSQKPRVLRLDRSSLVYPVDGTEVRVASPLGGGIYIEVPYLAGAGIVDVAIRNAVRSPFFSATSYHRTSLSEWQGQERQHEAPWADFQSDRFMMQVPATWIRELPDPASLMADWDRAVDAMNDLMGLPHVQGREALYLQVDLQLRASVFAPGYPTVNDRYDPKKSYDGYASHYLVRGPRYAPDYVFHEQGHGYNFVKFGGETESTVNLLHVAVWHRQFGYGLDEAFAASRGMQGNKSRTLDNTAVAWMTSSNFVNGKPMEAAEKAYQLKGHAKFVDIVRLFGWRPLDDFWRSWNEDLEAGRPWSKHGTDIDTLGLRLCRMAGFDLTPLLHFWGTPPRDAESSRAAVAAAKLPPSGKVYDALVRYRSLVPADRQAFRDFAQGWWGKRPSAGGFMTERDHARQWDEFSEESCARIQEAVQGIIDRYFPNGRPAGP